MARLKIIFVIGLVILGYFHSDAQVRTTKQTKLVLVVDENTEAVRHMILFADFQEMKQESALNKYPNSIFFVGLLQGSYSLNKKEVLPQSGATITIFTQKQLLWTDPTFVYEKLTSGDGFNLANNKARVLSSKKGELVVITQ